MKIKVIYIHVISEIIKSFLWRTSLLVIEKGGRSKLFINNSRTHGPGGASKPLFRSLFYLFVETGDKPSAINLLCVYTVYDYSRSHFFFYLHSLFLMISTSRC